MDNIVNKEISEELLKELGIKTLEEYNEMVKDDKKGTLVKHNKKKQIEQQVSKNKAKKILRKKEMVINKKLKNERRFQILESLEKHKVNESHLLENMESMKHLGKKRKHKDSLIREEEKEESQAEKDVLEEEVEMYSDSEMDIDDKEETTRQNNIEENKTETAETHFDILDEKVRAQILAEIKEFRSREVNEDAEIESDLKLQLPDKSNIIIVNRDEKIQNDRINLPIVKYEQEIMDKINNNLVTVVCGETGSGKSTQIPQFLYEFGYTNGLGGIAITQPRRVAAVSLATRVASELNVKLGEEVGYQVRYDSYHYGEKTCIKFLTDGILLKEIESDNMLMKYSVVIIDEAHERTINTDIIIGFLSKILRLRYMLAKYGMKYRGIDVRPLRVVIMSATMRVDEFMESSIFKPKPAFIKVEARQFPVTIHHMKRTFTDHVEEAFKMTCKIHRKLPDGGVLIFLTGKQEIKYLCERLKSEFQNHNQHEDKDEVASDKVLPDEIINNNGDIEDSDDEIEERISYKKALILPLYSALTQEQQMQVFQKPPEGVRLIVVATNVAETSLTIPNVRYVVDSGKTKRRVSL
jgi:ATP-dependent RNA helicase DHX37/DHR1